MPAILAVEVEGRATVEVVEEEVELSARTEESVAVEEAEIVVVETRIRMEVGATGIKNVGVRHA